MVRCGDTSVVHHYIHRVSSCLMWYDFHWLSAMNFSWQFNTNGRNTDQIISSTVNKFFNKVFICLFNGKNYFLASPL